MRVIHVSFLLCLIRLSAALTLNEIYKATKDAILSGEEKKALEALNRYYFTKVEGKIWNMPCYLLICQVKKDKCR